MCRSRGGRGSPVPPIPRERQCVSSRRCSSSSTTTEKSTQSETALGSDTSGEVELRAVVIIRCDFMRSLWSLESSATFTSADQMVLLGAVLNSPSQLICIPSPLCAAIVETGDTCGFAGGPPTDTLVACLSGTSNTSARLRRCHSIILTLSLTWFVSAASMDVRWFRFCRVSMWFRQLLKSSSEITRSVDCSSIRTLCRIITYLSHEILRADSKCDALSQT